jgi:hypothetical protein
VNRRIALGLILTLLVQSLLPGLAMALPAAPSSAQTLLICTADGIKEVALVPDAPGPATQDDDVPRAQPCCPCAIPCGACVASLDRLGVGVVYATVVALRARLGAAMPIAARAPPPHQSRAPPSSS